MHAAKGLEFPVVFVTGCEEGLIPFRHGNADRDDEAEERRLLYVAMTRAREQLYLTLARKRRIHGHREHRKPSPFLRDIEEELKRSESGGLKGKKKQCDQIQLKLF
jgi:superfamily I DNA/RNA helicase